MSRFLRAEYAALAPYTPGEQPRDLRCIKLNTNESPFPPSPRIFGLFSRSETEHLRLYPDPQAAALTAALAERYGVSPEQVIVGNGSDELLAFFFMAFCSESTPAVCPQISYGFYPVFAQFARVPYRAVPMREGLSINVRDFAGCGGNVVLANPNAPTGRALPVSDIEFLLRTNPDALVLVDEAYVDFGAESCLPLLERYDNLLVVRTFSKSRNLAGARIGFAFGSPEVISDLQRIRFSFNPYNISRFSLLAGQATVEDEAYFYRCCGTIIENRAYTESALRALGFEVLPSLANFVFARFPTVSGAALYAALKKRGVLVRHFDDPQITDYLRITIGSLSDMQALTEQLREILNEQEG